MKQAGNNARVVRNGEGQGWAAFLPGNYTAEHEWGIKDLLRILNIDPEGMGIDGRSMTAPCQLASAKQKITRNYFIEEDGKNKRKKITSNVTFVCTSDYYLEDARYREHDVTRYNHEDHLTGAWDGQNFKLAGWTPEANLFLDEIVEAAGRGDLTVMLGSPKGEERNPFARSGLIIAIRSRLPQDMTDEVNASDANTIALTKAANETGIRDKILAAKDTVATYYGQAFHALMPSWSENHHVVKEGPTKHPVVFYLNPGNDAKYKSGWYTVEELEEWLEGKGPVIKIEGKAA